MLLVESAVPYSFKESPYSSHSLLLARLPQEGRGRRVLDLGCGSGYLAAILAARGYAVTGVERTRAAAYPPECELIEWDLDYGLPPLASLYHFVLCADVLEHLKDPGRLLSQLPAVMTADAALVASLPNSGHLYFRLNVLFGRFPQHERGLFDRTHLHFYTWSNWRALFAGAGFAIESTVCSGVPVGLALPGRRHSLGVKAAERLSYDLARLWKRLFAYQFIVTARAPAP
jgi:SAM-dependent methyltransferase